MRPSAGVGVGVGVGVGARLSVALLISAAFVARALGQLTPDADVCCDVQPDCKNVTTINITTDQFTAQSPFFEPIRSSDFYTVIFQSVCTTYFTIREGLYLEFRTITQEDGNITITILLLADYPGTPGKFRVQGLKEGSSTVVFDLNIVDITCQSCQPVYMYYKCYYYDICDSVESTYNDVNGKSPSSEVAASCLDEFEARARAAGFRVSGFARPPGGGSYSCVAFQGNNTCVNYERIPPANRIRYPPVGDSGAC